MAKLTRARSEQVMHQNTPLSEYLAIFNYISPMQTGAVGDGVADDSAAVQAANDSGRPMLIDRPYNIKNLNLGGDIFFREAGKFVGMLGARDNMVVAKSGLRIFNGKFDKGLSAWAVDGDFGNAIRYGAYRNNSSAWGSGLVENCYLENCYVHNTTVAFNSQAIEVLGNVQHLHINGLTVEGKGAGIICHWGGDVGDAGAHGSIVTYSHHPRHIRLDNMLFRPDAAGNAPGNTVILSACYDVEITNLKSYEVERTLWVFPGDVYNEVSIGRDKFKPCTGIRVDGVHVQRPLATGDLPAVLVGGMPATERTNGDRAWGRDYRSYMDVTLDNVNITCDDVVYSKALFLMQGCKGVKANVNKSGGYRSTTQWCQLDYNDGCSGTFVGDSVISFRVRGCTACDFTVHAERHATDAARNSSECGLQLVTFDSGTLAVQGTAAQNARSITVVPASDGVLFNGAYIMVNDQPIGRVMKSKQAKAGVAVTLETTPLNAAVSGNIILSLPNEGTIIRGSLRGFLYNVKATKAWGFELELDCLDAYRGGMLFDGSYLRDVTINGSEFIGTGWEALEGGSATRWDVHVTATQVSNFKLMDTDMDSAMYNPNVSQRLGMNTTDHKGVIITGIRARGTSSGVAFAVNNSTSTELRNMQQIYGNCVDENEAPLATVVGHYVGGTYYGMSRANAAPTTGHWKAGDRVLYSMPQGAVGGKYCSAAGAPGSWSNIAI